MDGCTCGRCSVYSAPEVLCKGALDVGEEGAPPLPAGEGPLGEALGALLKLYIAEAKKAQSLENELDKHAKGKGK